MKYIYLAILIFSIFGLFLVDKKYNLVFYENLRAASRSIIIVMAVLLFVDVIGINWNIFSTNQNFVSGLYVGNPNLPIEEFIFLFMLCYFVLSLSNFLKRKNNNV